MGRVGKRRLSRDERHRTGADRQIGFAADLAGFWSYIGTEILEIDEDEPTLNLEGFTMRTSDAEFRRVVRHEAGHTLGFDHEHMRSDIVKRIDRAKAIAFYDKDQGWTPEEVEEQVLTPLAKRSIMGTAESDPLSIMCYHLPAAIMKDGKAVKGGKTSIPGTGHSRHRYIQRWADAVCRRGLKSKLGESTTLEALPGVFG